MAIELWQSCLAVDDGQQSIKHKPWNNLGYLHVFLHKESSRDNSLKDKHH